jgi:hypothetical protein
MGRTKTALTLDNTIVPKKIFFLFFLTLTTVCLAQPIVTSSVLRSGNWYKFSITADGVYKIDYNLLKKAGINPDKIDPKKLRIYAAGNGMLPQLNSASRISDLNELSISVAGEEDGKFNKEDFIIFYGQGTDVIEFDGLKNIFKYQNHLYSDKNYYFLTISDAIGKRLTSQENTPGSFPVINQFDDFSYYENDKYNVLSSGREWFGEQFDTSPEIKIRFDLSDVVENSEIKIISHVMSQSNDPTSFKLFFNNVEIKEQNIAPIPNTQYGVKGRKGIDTISVAAASVNATTQNTHELKYQYVKGTTSRSIGYLDLISIYCKRKLKWTGKPFSFISSQSLQNATSTFEIEAMPSAAQVWDITDPFNAKLQTTLNLTAKTSYSTSTTQLKKFITFDGVESFPTFETQVPNQNLHSSTSYDLLIVTHPTFKSEAERLAAHRQSHNKIKVLVATTEEIYNEYAGGKPDLSAIRDFARSLYFSGGLKNILLFGRCSYDYKDRIIDNSNFVPTYESLNSLSPLETYSSDDYFGFLEANEGEWKESPVQNHTMEIGVGRISVKKIEDAQNVVDKLIAYDTDQNAFDKWRKDILFVADDGDFNIHQSQANQMADEISLNHPDFNSVKLFLDSYKQLERPSGQYSTEATNALNRLIDKGALIVNFTGHGSEHVWMQERIFQPSSLDQWKNKHQFPLFVTATCEFGRHDDPLIISSGELVMNKKNAGAIGLVTTARPVNSSTNFILNKAFYYSLFQKSNGAYKDLGTVFRDTKNQSLSDVSNRNFSLLGDPSMQLAIPEKEIIINEIKTLSGSDTVKALSTVVIKGQIKNSSDFNGNLQATLFDKENSQKTLGDENPVFTFNSFDHILYQGKTSIESGQFEIVAMIPKTIDFTVGNGKLSLYAYNEEFTNQASGSLINFKVGKTESMNTVDSKGPDIDLFMGDTTYYEGGVVGTNTFLVAKLFDEHGINISGYENGNLEILLDDSLSFIGNQFYESSLNNFQNGLLNFPITELAQGNHVLKLKAWDTYGNSSERSISFLVGEANQLIVDSFFNYPNPLNEITTFQFSHNRPGEDLVAQLIIYNSIGELINNISYSVNESLYTVTLTEWDGIVNGTKLTNGIYFVKLQVRSLTDGAKNEKLTKLIILN